MFENLRHGHSKKLRNLQKIQTLLGPNKSGCFRIYIGRGFFKFLHDIPIHAILGVIICARNRIVSNPVTV